MSRDRQPVDFRPAPLAREREGCRLTERAITARLCEIIERLDRATAAVMPSLSEDAWSLILWAGWNALEHERIVSRDRPQDIDVLAWGHMVREVAERDEDLARRLSVMTLVERVAVLEMVEAYGRAEAMK